MTDEPLLGMFTGTEAEIVRKLVHDIETSHQMNLSLVRALTIALGNAQTSVTIQVGDDGWLPWTLDHTGDDATHSITFYVKPNAPRPPTDPRLSEDQILRTAMVGAYGLALHKASGLPPEQMHATKPQAMIYPGTGLLALATACWESMPDANKEYHLARAADYLREAIEYGAWPNGPENNE